MVQIGTGAPIFVIVTMDIGTGSRFLSPIPMSSVTGSVRRDRDSESLTLSERGGKWEGDQEKEREKGRLNEGHKDSEDKFNETTKPPSTSCELPTREFWATPRASKRGFPSYRM